MNSRLLSMILLSPIAAYAAAQSGDHNFNVKDDIAMVRFNDPSVEQADLEARDTKYSPDGNYVAVVTTRGLLDTDQIESSVSVFDLRIVGNFLQNSSPVAPKPRVIAIVASHPSREQLSAYAPAIKDLQWAFDSCHLYFRAENSLGAMQLDEVNIDGGQVHQLTPDDFSVNRFTVGEHILVYTASRMDKNAHPAQGERINADALAVTGHRLADILFPGQITSSYPETLMLGTVREGGDKHVIHLVPGYATPDIALLLNFLPFRLSPDGRQLLMLAPVRSVPESWERYDPDPVFEHRRLKSNDTGLIDPNNAMRPRQYALIELSTGKVTSLIGGPNARTLGYYADANLATWATDGSRLLVTNVFLPLDTRNVGFSPPLTKPCAVATVDLPSFQTRCLFFREKDPSPREFHVDVVRFGRNRDEVFVTTTSSSKQRTTDVFRLERGVWESVSTTQAKAGDLSATPGGAPIGPTHVQISVRQDLNTPPTLWASIPDTSKARELWEPNPQLRRLNFGEASVYHWKDSGGRDWTGGLVKPVGYIAGRRYPFVIQMYQFREDEFLTDGTEPSAFAARELASAGFVVLQIRKQLNTLSETDPRTHLEGYQSAIKSLDDAGLIDPSRVGVVGFSWTCWYAVNAIVKAPKLFAAATIADGLDNSYMQYLLFTPGQILLRSQIDQLRGGGPFGPTMKNWIEDAPGFHLDQVQTPVRIETMEAVSVLQEWELYASLYLQHKPVDLIYFPEGSHIHQRPLERLESQQGNVDWMRFWLQGYEDPDPIKKDQYQRWRKMKDDHHGDDPIKTQN